MTGNFWTTIDEVIVISLQRRTDRLENFMKAVSSLGKQPIVFPAFDNRLYNLSSAGGETLHMGPGFIGCYLSHLAVIKYCIAKNHQRVMVFEDDALLLDDFNERIEQLINKLPEGWQMAYMHYGASNKEQLASSKYCVAEEVFRSNYIGSTAGYILNATGFLKLHNVLDKAIQGHIDHAIADYNVAHDDFYSYYFSPSLIEVNTSLGTDIQQNINKHYEQHS